MGHRSHLHVAAPHNTQGNCTYIDHPDADGNPAAILLASHIYNPPGRPSAYHNHHIGVWYNDARGKWAVFNQDRSDMAAAVAFHLEILLPGEDWAFLHVATRDNTVENSTYLDHRFANGKPHAAVLVTPAYLSSSAFPPASEGVYNDRAIGVWYERKLERWAIFNQLEGPPYLTAHAGMPLGAAFHVEVLSGENYPSFSEHVVFHVADASNTQGHVTNINFGDVDRDPNVKLIFTPNYNPRGAAGGTYNNRATGLWYNAGIPKWAVYNEDLSPMPAGAAFNVRE